MLAESAAASAESAQESAETAETYAEHVPVVVDGYWAMWNGTDYVPTAQRAQGEPGTPGADGDDGVSPEVTIGSITGGHSVIITDRDHPDGQTFNVMDGDQGDPGPGVPAGGVPGQLLAKKTVDDYDGEWVDPTAELLSYDDTETYSSGTVGAEIGGLKNTLNTLDGTVDDLIPSQIITLSTTNVSAAHTGLTRQSATGTIYVSGKYIIINAYIQASGIDQDKGLDFVITIPANTIPAFSVPLGTSYRRYSPTSGLAGDRVAAIHDANSTTIRIEEANNIGYRAAATHGYVMFSSVIVWF